MVCILSETRVGDEALGLRWTRCSVKDKGWVLHRALVDQPVRGEREGRKRETAIKSGQRSTGTQKYPYSRNVTRQVSRIHCFSPPPSISRW